MRIYEHIEETRNTVIGRRCNFEMACGKICQERIRLSMELGLTIGFSGLYLKKRKKYESRAFDLNRACRLKRRKQIWI
jgi:hypothetical protein